MNTAIRLLSRLPAAAAAAAIFLACSCAAVHGTGPPPRPCTEVRTVTPPDPCRDLAAAACAPRMEFVRRMFASTVAINVSRYSEARGIEYFSGTGAVIDADTVLTARHVVDGAMNDTVIVIVRRLADNGRDIVRVRDIPMRIVASSPERDVALLRRVGTDTLPPALPVRRAPLRAGDPLWHFGNVSFWNSGRVNGLDVTYDGMSGLTRVDFACRHGDSGAPMFSSDGEIVGVLVKKDGDGEGVGQTYFTPVDIALRALHYAT